MPVVTPRFDLDPDPTLGGANASNEVGATQKAVKDYVDNRPGLTVDQTYDSTSTNAQSGTAVAEAISTKANDSDVVKLTGDQDIDGLKTFKRYVTRGVTTSNSSNESISTFVSIDTALDTSIIPPYYKEYIWGAIGTNSRYLGFINFIYSTDGSTYAGLSARTRNTGNTDNVTGTISVRARKNGTVFTYAPTPNEADGLNQIATVGSVRNRTGFSGGTNRTTLSITLGSSFSTPADGLLIVTLNLKSSDSQGSLLLGGTDGYIVMKAHGYGSSASIMIPLVFPARKNQTFAINKTGTVTVENAYLWEFPYQGV